MQAQRYYYIFQVQYLGYRLHGWQRQPGYKTVEGLIKKTLKFVLEDRRFKILGSSRTDAMVSAQGAAFELFLDGTPLEDHGSFLKLFNQNLPPDIRALSIKEVDASFNIIQQPKFKEYLYLFSYGEKSHPFAAPFMATFLEDLDIAVMKKAAKLFEGQHHFRNYCTKPTEHTILDRELELCEIVENTDITASFFPDSSYLLRVQAAGFLRNQIRLMMGSLVLVGRGELTLEDISESLQPDVHKPMNYIAPGSGLVLNKLSFSGIEQ